MSENSNIQFDIKVKILFIFFIPLLIFIFLEVIFRIINLEKIINSQTKEQAQIQLDMPTWMMKDQNQLIRNKDLSERRDKIDWFDIFEEGQGFRVRLQPNLKKRITNTFSLIDYDKKQGYLVQSNSIGFRGPEITKEKALDTYRILIFGDSSSFGWGIDQKDTFYNQLPKKLQQEFQDKKFEIGNFAIPGDSSEYGKLIVEKFISDYRADFVIFGFGANDAKKTYVEHRKQVEKFKNNSFFLKLRALAMRLAVYRVLNNLINKEGTGLKSPVKKSAVKISEYAENLNYMIELANENQLKSLILSLCTPGNYAQTAKRIAKKNNQIYFNGQAYLVKLLDDIINAKYYPELLLEMTNNYKEDLNKDKLLYITSDGCHPNKLANYILADKISQLIKSTINK